MAKQIKGRAAFMTPTTVLDKRLHSGVPARRTCHPGGGGHVTHQVWRQAETSQLSNAALGWFGFLLPSSLWLRTQIQIRTEEEVMTEVMSGVNITGPYLWDQADMDVAEVLPLHLELELPEGLNKGHTLNVSDRSAQLLAHSAALESRNR